MKFMKLGSKPDSFQTKEDGNRYVATELATDIVINIGDVKFHLHKFPLLSKSMRLQKLVATPKEENSEEICIQDIPGGPAAFEICAKFCYGMTVTLNAYNVVAARCAAEYLEMHEGVEKGNLIYKIEVFLNSSLLRSWKDSIIALQTTKSLLPWSEELQIVSHCIDSIASKASVDILKVEWSYTYNRKKIPSENGNADMRKHQTIPKDWWVEDLCELPIDLYERLLTTIKAKERVSCNVIGESLKAYFLRRLPGFAKGINQGCDALKYRSLAETIIWLLPTEKGSVPCSFLIRLLHAAILLECRESMRNEVMRRISQQLEEATVGDLLIRAPHSEKMMYDVDIVQKLVEEFVAQNKNAQAYPVVIHELEEIRTPGIISDTSKIIVAKLVDGYLAEVARDPNLPLSKFLSLAETVSTYSRPSHDGLYRAIDMYLKEHPGMNKSEKKRLCRLMDCRKLSVYASAHAVQNERLPLRVIVQVLFFEQVKAATSSAGNSTPEIPGAIQALLPGGSHGSSRTTTTNTEDDFDTIAKLDDVNALKGEMSTLRLGLRGADRNENNGAKSNVRSTNGLLKSRILSEFLSSKVKNGDTSSSETSESPPSMNAEETRSIPSRSRRH